MRNSALIGCMSQRGGSFCHLDGRDATRPEVTSVVISGIWILVAGDDLRSHPVWCAYECISPSNRPVQLSAYTKINKFHLRVLSQQHVLPLDVSVNDMVNVEMGQPLRISREM